MLRSLLSSRVLALGLACALAACGGGSSDNDPPAGNGGKGGTGGTGGTDGGGGTGGTVEECKRPRIERLEPDTGVVGDRVLIHGSCFSPEKGKNSVQFNGTKSAVFEVSADGTQLATSVPSGATTGRVTVFTDYGSGPVRADGPTFTLSNNNPSPSLSSVTPDHVTVGTTGSVTVRLAGGGFFFGSEVLLDGEPITASFDSTTNLNATIPADRLGAVRTLTLQVRNAAPGGGTSATVQFRVVAKLNLVSALATAADKVQLTFDRPVNTSMATSRDNYRIAAGASTLTVRSAARLQDTRKVVLTTSTQSRNLNYAVTVADNFESQEGGVIDVRQTAFRSFGSDPEPAGTYGRTGCGNAGFSTPAGVSVKGTRVYVTELTGHQVQIVDLQGAFAGFVGNDGTSLGLHTDAGSNALGCPGSGASDRAFSFPRGGVAVDTGGDFYVADTGNDRVFRFGSAGAYQGTHGTGITWQSPVVLGFSGGTVWVANDDNKIYRVPPSGNAAPPLFGPGIGPGQFAFGLGDGRVPAMAETGNVHFVSDPNNHRVHKFIDLVARGWIGKGHTGFVTGPVDCLANGTCAGGGNGEFTFPSGVAIDATGALWVVDEANGGRLQKFTQDGAFVSSVNLGYMPGGVAVDSDGYLWIADQDADALHRYRI